MFMLEEPLQLHSQLVRIHHLAFHNGENICGSLQHRLVQAPSAIIKYLTFRLYLKKKKNTHTHPFSNQFKRPSDCSATELCARRQHLKTNNCFSNWIFSKISQHLLVVLVWKINEFHILIGKIKWTHTSEAWYINNHIADRSKQFILIQFQLCFSRHRHQSKILCLQLVVDPSCRTATILQIWKSDSVSVCECGGDQREFLFDDTRTLITAVRTIYGATVIKASLS